MDFDTFMRNAWAEHGDQPALVAERIGASPKQVKSVDQIAPFAALVVHVFGEHLGR